MFRWIEDHPKLLAVAVLMLLASGVAWAASQGIDGPLRLGGPVTVSSDLNVKQDISVTLDLLVNGDTQLGNSAGSDAVTVTASLTTAGEAVFSDSTYHAENIEQAVGKMLKTSYVGFRPLAGSKADTSLLPRNALFVRNDSLLMLIGDKTSVVVIYP